ncbi:MAG: hypothetical protein HKP53_07265 [Eudoraea sp.]|nr:hypothetical protein [Eudoraea sp.]
MRKIMSAFFLLLLSVACQESAEGKEEIKEELQFLQVTAIPQRVILNAKASEISRDWMEFNALNIGFDALYKVENEEDLAFVLDDLVERQKALEDSKYPPEFDLPQVRSRQKVMKTFILKTRAAVEYRIDATEPAVEMMEAYNALRNQFNVIVNNTLDLQLLSDE